MNTSLAYCVNDLQLLSGDKMFTKAGPSNTLQLTGELSHGILSSFGSKQSTIQDFDLTGLNSPQSDKKEDLADFHVQRSFQDHLHVFDKL